MDSIKRGAPNNLTLSLDYRLISALLLVIIVGMLAFWRPWEDARAKDRTIEVSGQAKVTAMPDEFVFYPSYEFKNANKQVALGELTKKSTELVAKLKELGVADSKIKTNSDGGQDYPVYKDDLSVPAYTLRLTVTAGDKDLAQKVQDYLLTTSPSGAVSPQANFSDAKRKELEVKAREQATSEARAKAEQSAKNLGFRIGDVKTVTDGAGFGVSGSARGTAVDLVSPQMAIQPGENDLYYSVTVVYFVR